MAILECKGLCKSYGAEPALDRVDLSVEPGHIVGLLGPNGSGKTHAHQAGQRPAHAGQPGKFASTGKAPCRETKKIVSYLPERTVFCRLDDGAAAAGRSSAISTMILTATRPCR